MPHGLKPLTVILNGCDMCRSINFSLLWQTHEATKVFEHLVSLGVKPNAMSYSLLVDAHLMNRNVKDAITVIDDMVSAIYLFVLCNIFKVTDSLH